MPDLLGFGRSPRPESGYTPDAHADAVAETMRTAGVEAPILIGGHSLGALVALRLAIRHPDLVSGVVAFAPPIYRDEATARRQIGSTDPLARLLLVNEELCAKACEFMCRHPRLSAALVRLARPTLPAPLATDRVEHSWASYHETVADPGRQFVFVTGRPEKPETRWRYVLEPEGGGATRVTESFDPVKLLGAVSDVVTRLTTGVRDRRASLEERRTSLARIKEIAQG